MDYPPFLQGKDVLHPAKVGEHMRNWPVFFRVLQKASIEEVKQYLRSELAGKLRPDFISRAYKRFTRLRREQELAAVHKTWPTAGMRNGRFL